MSSSCSKESSRSEGIGAFADATSDDERRGLERREERREERRHEREQHRTSVSSGSIDGKSASNSHSSSVTDSPTSRSRRLHSLPQPPRRQGTAAFISEEGATSQHDSFSSAGSTNSFNRHKVGARSPASAGKRASGGAKEGAPGEDAPYSRLIAQPQPPKRKGTSAFLSPHGTDGKEEDVPVAQTLSPGGAGRLLAEPQPPRRQGTSAFEKPAKKTDRVSEPPKLAVTRQRSFLRSNSLFKSFRPRIKKVPQPPKRQGTKMFDRAPGAELDEVAAESSKSSAAGGLASRESSTSSRYLAEQPQPPKRKGTVVMLNDAGRMLSRSGSFLAMSLRRIQPGRMGNIATTPQPPQRQGTVIMNSSDDALDDDDDVDAGCCGRRRRVVVSRVGVRTQPRVVIPVEEVANTPSPARLGRPRVVSFGEDSADTAPPSGGAPSGGKRTSVVKFASPGD